MCLLRCSGHLARVAELVDALDLGSSGEQPWGFESPLSHQVMSIS